MEPQVAAGPRLGLSSAATKKCVTISLPSAPNLVDRSLDISGSAAASGKALRQNDSPRRELMLAGDVKGRTLRLMPTVCRIGPYRLFFFSDERGEPPHIHVKREDREGKVWLVAVTVARGGDFRPNELRTIIRIVRDNRTILLEAWYDHFKSRS